VSLFIRTSPCAVPGPPVTPAWCTTRDGVAAHIPWPRVIVARRTTPPPRHTMWTPARPSRTPLILATMLRPGTPLHSFFSQLPSSSAMKSSFPTASVSRSYTSSFMPGFVSPHPRRPHATKPTPHTPYGELIGCFNGATYLFFPDAAPQCRAARRCHRSLSTGAGGSPRRGEALDVGLCPSHPREQPHAADPSIGGAITATGHIQRVPKSRNP
jgi:hypothetical protein